MNGSFVRIADLADRSKNGRFWQAASTALVPNVAITDVRIGMYNNKEDTGFNPFEQTKL